jgi:hypothetical protein
MASPSAELERLRTVMKMIAMAISAWQTQTNVQSEILDLAVQLLRKESE